MAVNCRKGLAKAQSEEGVGKTAFERAAHGSLPGQNPAVSCDCAHPLLQRVLFVVTEGAFAWLRGPKTKLKNRGPDASQEALTSAEKPRMRGRGRNRRDVTYITVADIEARKRH